MVESLVPRWRTQSLRGNWVIRVLASSIDSSVHEFIAEWAIWMGLNWRKKVIRRVPWRVYLSLAPSCHFLSLVCHKVSSLFQHMLLSPWYSVSLRAQSKGSSWPCKELSETVNQNRSFLLSNSFSQVLVMATKKEKRKTSLYFYFEVSEEL
jgi:hypothetical protein